MWIFPDCKSYQVGPDGDIRPPSIAVVAGHCEISRLESESIQVTAGAGKVYINGAVLEEGSKELQPYDRVAIGNTVYLFHWPGKDPPEDPPNAVTIMREYVKAAATDSSEANQKVFAEQQAVQEAEHAKAMESMQAEFEAKLQAMQSAMATGGGDAVTQDDIDKAKQAFESKEQAAKESFVNQRSNNGLELQLQDLLRKAPVLAELCQRLDRANLGFEVKLTPGEQKADPPKPKVVVRNSSTGEQVVQDPWEFENRFQIVQEELSKIRLSLDNDVFYEVPSMHDPVVLLFDNMFKLGSAQYHLMECAALMETGMPLQNIRNAVAPFNEVGTLEVMMTPIRGPEDLTPISEDEAPDDPSELVGKPWTYLLEVKGVSKLKVRSDETFVQYMFNQDLFCTEVVDTPGNDLKFEFKQIHHVAEVTEAFLAYLDEGAITFEVFVNPVLDPPTSKVDTNNPTIRKLVGAVGSGSAKPQAGAGESNEAVQGEAASSSALAQETPGASASDAEIQKATEDALQAQHTAEEALTAERTRVKELEGQVAKLEQIGRESPAPQRVAELEQEVARLKTELEQKPKSGMCTLL